MKSLYNVFNYTCVGIAGGGVEAAKAASNGRTTPTWRLLGGRCRIRESPRIFLFIPLRLQSHRDNAKTKDWPRWDRSGVQKIFPRKGKIKNIWLFFPIQKYFVSVTKPGTCVHNTEQWEKYVHGEYKRGSAVSCFQIFYDTHYYLLDLICSFIFCGSLLLPLHFHIYFLKKKLKHYCFQLGECFSGWVRSQVCSFIDFVGGTSWLSPHFTHSHFESLYSYIVHKISWYARVTIFVSVDGLTTSP